MNNKYYTPSLEEFHVGFRLEFIEASPIQTMINNRNPNELKSFQYIEDERTWSKCTYLKHEPNRCNLIEGLAGEYSVRDILYLIRVKYLDRDDIEELGWVYKGNHWYYKGDEYYEFNIDEDSSYFLHAHHYLSEGPVRYSIINGSPTHLYGLSDSSYVFDGEIRNYNELKFIMERVDIKKEQNESKE